MSTFGKAMLLKSVRHSLYQEFGKNKITYRIFIIDAANIDIEYGIRVELQEEIERLWVNQVMFATLLELDVDADLLDDMELFT